MPRRWIYILLCGIVACAFAAARCADFGARVTRDYDEGVYLCLVRTALHGAPLYGANFTPVPPVYLQTLALSFRVFEDAIATARAVNVSFAVLALASTAAIAWSLAGPPAALLAMVTLASSRLFFTQAIVCQPDNPSVSLALLGLALLLWARRTRLLIATAGAGASYALGALSKLLVAPMFVPFSLLLAIDPASLGSRKWRAQRPSPTWARRTGFFLAGALGTGLLILWPYRNSDLARSIVAYHLKVHALLGSSQAPHILELLARDQLGAVLLAAAGLAALARKNVLAACWLGLWLAGADLLLVCHRPFFMHHLALILPPVAVAAAVAVLWIAPLAPKARRFAFPALIVLPLVSWQPGQGLVFGALGRDLAVEWKRNREPTQEDRLPLGTILSRTAPGDFIVTDEPIQAYYTGRNIPPALCDTSFVRIGSGYLTDAAAIENSRGARMILLWTHRLETLPEYVRWVSSHYRLLKQPDAGGGRKIYILDGGGITPPKR